MEIVYKKESKDYGNDCLVYKSAFVVKVQNGYVATKNVIYQGSWCGFNTRSNSFVYDENHLDAAIKFCDEDF